MTQPATHLGTALERWLPVCCVCGHPWAAGCRILDGVRYEGLLWMSQAVKSEVLSHEIVVKSRNSQTANAYKHTMLLR